LSGVLSAGYELASMSKLLHVEQVRSFWGAQTHRKKTC